METPALIKSRTDFADWLSPMLVKELRQGVRTRVFVTLFILLQLLMLLDISLSLLVAAGQEDTTAGTVFFWLLVGLPVLVILPINGLNAVGSEIKANTLELIFLTRLTAFRIVIGKWFAIFAQSLLMVCAVLPYLVLRYFIGGVNISTELFILALMLLGSALLAGIATGISAYPIRMVRALAGVGGVLLVPFGIGLISSLVGSRGGFSGPGPGWLDFFSLLLCGIIVLLLMLQVGAAKIAPPAENHSAVIRVLTLAGFAVALAATFVLGRYSEVTTMILFIVAVLVCTVALCEQPRWIPSLYRPFARRGWPGRIVGRFFYPGWHTGVWFTLIVFGVFGGLLAYQKMLHSKESVVVMAALAGTLLLPPALIRTFLPRTNRAVAFFFLVQGLCAMVTIFCLVCDNALNTHFKRMISFLPLSTLIMSFNDYEGRVSHWLVPVTVTTGLSLIALVVASVRAMRPTRLMEDESLRLPAPPPSHASLA